eukprot:CAMPEP_0197050426 /NCGR_PEP_ID=MMETSP1384-20130603/25317_1 /TAXON_ID=29189 /ORGANISM="Ammonia sp." /LENGTH=31 /DNA_ID= /DNA_START= /DNA_END= /DNA_ORIENTATION=
MTLSSLATLAANDQKDVTNDKMTISFASTVV